MTTLKLTQLEFTTDERKFLNTCMDVVATFMIQLQGDGHLVTLEDAKRVEHVRNNPEKFEALLRKINFDIDLDG
jgi:hypothetical protein